MTLPLSLIILGLLLLGVAASLYRRLLELIEPRDELVASCDDTRYG